MHLRAQNPAPHWIKLPEVDREIERFSGQGFVSLHFARLLEGQFHTERAAARVRQLTTGGLITLAIFDLFLMEDWLLAPQLLWRSLVVRLGVITPLVLLALLLRGRRRVLVQELWAVSLCVAGVAASLYLKYAVPSMSLHAEHGVLCILLAMNTLLRPDFRISLVGTALCYAELLTFLWVEQQLNHLQDLAVGGRVFWFAVLSLAANYALAREQRISWLQQLRGRIQHRMLADSNRELMNLSLTDPLTGLPNRAAYDRRLAELWKQACRTREPLAAIMVDVDHFKSINDAFGHLYGDRVLQRVGSLLEQAMRAEADFVSRFGGEEFIVLLPGSSLEGGLQVAERIRLLVQVAGSPAPIQGESPLPPDTRWSTVSCGVSSVRPAPGDDPSCLIDAADHALYVAKQTGRNRVCRSVLQEPPCDEPEPKRREERRA